MAFASAFTRLVFKQSVNSNFNLCKAKAIQPVAVAVAGAGRYSQQTPKQVEIQPPALKKRERGKRAKKVFLEGQQKSAFWNTIAVATAEEYNLEELYNFLVKSNLYAPSPFAEQLYKSDVGFNFVHVVAKDDIDNERKDIFVFREGSLVAWNVSEADVQNIVGLVRAFERNSYDSAIVNAETEVMPYTYVINNKLSSFQNGSICLTQAENKSLFDKYTFSNGMVLSVKLAIWETLLDKYIHSVASLTSDLKFGEKLKISRKEVLRKSGELYSLKHSINLSSDLLDIPDFYWEREELEALYLNTCRYFNIPRRTKVINEKLNHCIELVDLLSSHLSDKHHTRLEWMIIILIMVEVGFEILHYAPFFIA